MKGVCMECGSLIHLDQMGDRIGSGWCDYCGAPRMVDLHQKKNFFPRFQGWTLSLELKFPPRLTLSRAPPPSVSGGNPRRGG